jgi:hypothetical protein
MLPRSRFLIAVLVAAGGAVSAAPPTQVAKIPPSRVVDLQKVDLTRGIAFPCPVVNAVVKVDTHQGWQGKHFGQNGLKASQLHAQAGSTRDVMWCSYEFTGPHAPGSETHFLLRKDATLGAPVCNADPNTLTFTCFPLKPGEYY